MIVQAIDAAISAGEEPDPKLLLVLAETRDSLGDPQQAAALYEQVIQKAPHNALARAGLGLLLLGTGARNYGAINACGLNREAALSHLQLAQVLEPSLKPVKEAISFCRMESDEVLSWRDIVSRDFVATSPATTTSTTSSTTARIEEVKNGDQNVLAAAIHKFIALPMKAKSRIMKVLSSLLRAIKSAIGLKQKGSPGGMKDGAGAASSRAPLTVDEMRLEKAAAMQKVGVSSEYLNLSRSVFRRCCLLTEFSQAVTSHVSSIKYLII
jgi:tetratricopeptide (TPR) repeat protein